MTPWVVLAALVLAVVVSLVVDRTRHHVCRPPDAYWEEGVEVWMTRNPVGCEHHCRCGQRWTTVSYAGGPWGRWVRR